MSLKINTSLGRRGLVDAGFQPNGLGLPEVGPLSRSIYGTFYFCLRMRALGLLRFADHVLAAHVLVEMFLSKCSCRNGVVEMFLLKGGC